MNTQKCPWCLAEINKQFTINHIIDRKAVPEKYYIEYECGSSFFYDIETQVLVKTNHARPEVCYQRELLNQKNEIQKLKNRIKELESKYNTKYLIGRR